MAKNFLKETEDSEETEETDEKSSDSSGSLVSSDSSYNDRNAAATRSSVFFIVGGNFLSASMTERWS